MDTLLKYIDSSLRQIHPLLERQDESTIENIINMMTYIHHPVDGCEDAGQMIANLVSYVAKSRQ